LTCGKKDDVALNNQLNGIVSSQWTTSGSNINYTAGGIGVAGPISGQYATGSGPVLYIGNDSSLQDIDIPNTAGLYGSFNSAVASLKLGSSGGLISGYNGNIGVATTTPGDKLEIGGSSSTMLFGSPSFTWGGTVGLYPTIYGSHVDRYVMIMFPHVPYKKNGYRGFTGTVEGAAIRFEEANNGTYSGYWDVGVNPLGSSGAYNKFSITRNAAAFLTVDSGGYVGIGTTSPGLPLEVIGNIAAEGVRLSGGSGGIWDGAQRWRIYAYGNTFLNGGTYQGSDARFKKNVRAIDDPLAKIEELRGVEYEYDRDTFPDRQFADGPQLGVISQEVEEVVPEVVAKDMEGYGAVTYSGFVPLLIEAIKELKAQKDSEILALRDENAALMARLYAIEKSLR
jgi:hypothetical protein